MAYQQAVDQGDACPLDMDYEEWLAGRIVERDWQGDFVQKLGFTVNERSAEDGKKIGRFHLANSDPDTLVLWVDASGWNPAVGACGWAVMRSEGYRITHIRSGTLSAADRPAGSVVRHFQFTEPELCPVAEALDAAVELMDQAFETGQSQTFSKVLVLSDCRDAVKSVGKYKEKEVHTLPGEYSNVKILRCGERLQQLGVHCTVDHTKGHAGLDGNVAADLVAGARAGRVSWASVAAWRSGPVVPMPIYGVTPVPAATPVRPVQFH